MSRFFMIALSVFITVIGYRMATCKKCRYEAILIGIISLNFMNYPMLALRIIIMFLVGEFIISKYKD